MKQFTEISSEIVKSPSSNWFPQNRHPPILTLIKILSKVQIQNRSSFSRFLKKDFKSFSLLKFQDDPFLNSGKTNLLKFCSSKRVLKSLSKFHLELSCQYYSLENKLKHVSKMIKNLRRLTKVELGLIGSRQLTRQTIKDLALSFKALKYLASISLNFSYCKNIPTESLQIFILCIKRIKKLSYLHINFTSCSKISSQDIISLRRGISTLKNLRALHLDFTNLEEIVEDSTVEGLISGISKLKPLSHLNLNFAGCNKISSASLYSIAACLKKLRSLANFTLNVTRCQNIKGEGLKGLSQGIESLEFLSVLSLDFSENKNIGDIGIKNLAEGLKNDSSLLSFSLTLDNNKEITDEGPLALCSQLVNCKKLQKIQIRMNDNLLGDLSLESFASLFKELQELAYVELGLATTFKFTDSAFVKMLESLENLKVLKLDFKRCKGLTDRSLFALASNIKTWSLLSVLELNFYSSFDMIKKGIKAICCALQDLQYLLSVRLIFSPFLDDFIPEDILDLLEGVKCETIVYNNLML